MNDAFVEAMRTGYALDEPSIVIGSPMHEGELTNEPRVQVALSMMNRHGLVAGATAPARPRPCSSSPVSCRKPACPYSSGRQGRPHRPGRARRSDEPEGDRTCRTACLAVRSVRPSGRVPVAQRRARGAGACHRQLVRPLLLGKVLDLNETQTSILALVFKYCDDNDLALLDLKDLATTLKFLASDEGKPILAEYGGMSKASVGVLLR